MLSKISSLKLHTFKVSTLKVGNLVSALKLAHRRRSSLKLHLGKNNAPEDCAWSTHTLELCADKIDAPKLCAKSQFCKLRPHKAKEAALKVECA